MKFFTSTIFTFFLLGNLVLGRPKKLQRTEKTIASKFGTRDATVDYKNIFGGDSSDVTDIPDLGIGSIGQPVSYNGQNNLIGTSDID